MLKKYRHYLVPTFFLLIIFALYNANLREVKGDDAIPARYVATSLVLDGDVFLNEFSFLHPPPRTRLPYYLYRSRGNILSTYPVATPLLASPVFYYFKNYFNWDLSFVSQKKCHFLLSLATKVSASLLTVFSVLFLYLALGKMGFTSTRYLTCSVYALCTSTWSISSQSLWQHTGVEFCLAGGIYFSLLSKERISMLAPTGFFLAAMTASRLLMVVFAAPMALTLIYHHRKSNLLKACLYIFPIPIIVAILLLNYNQHYFGTVLGGERYLELLHPLFHKVTGNWATPFLEGLYGIFLSPSRGLFLYSPILIFSFLMVLYCLRKNTIHPFLRFMALPFFIFVIIMCKYSVWWGGWSFGPRYFTDVQPLLALYFGQGATLIFCNLKTIALRVKIALGTMIFILAIYSFFIQTLGTFYYPCGWNNTPSDVDANHHRLWSWSDTQIGRCVKHPLQKPIFSVLF